MRRHRNVKIVATLGPASSDYKMIRALMEAGADVFRLNMSHGSHDEIRERHAIIRQIEKDLGTPIGILADLQGPKLRVGTFANPDGEELEVGASFRLDLADKPGDATRVTLPHKEIFDALEPGSHLLVNDGKIKLRVRDCGADFADCEVIVGGTISNRKGVNVPDVVLPLAALSEKDRDDLEFVCELGVDWLALSFVQRPADVIEARRLAGDRAAILSKIEKPAAVNAFDAILEVSDGIMVARGDLGVELPVQNVPPIQKRLIRKCRAVAKPVIVATQMLESMIDSPMPTRAEVSDVAAAIYEGTDAVMLSAESAAGQFPIEAVRTMDNVAAEVESDPTYTEIIEASRKIERTSVADGIVSAAREIAEATKVAAICCFSESGTTALLVSRERPRVPIIALTTEPSTARRLCLSWGTNNVITGPIDRFKGAVVSAVRASLAEGLATEDDMIVVTAGVPFNTPGSTNILRVAPCQERLIYSADPE
ncbi:pyruvate kinase [Ponticoccus sp. SC2-23]|uniref:pyruvate kinase n=1 Tax=Alexandriicola marinus TaxID=2081710 RepID=UPI000FD9CD69|nr:pyruvate kinase [Alexandriicola marinus]MBM1222096.1 pyruvate kinase [Ponticoccus sp. SC6-9]MBM1226783.1 pyruvate kinase [Ponticoccus sp. SC6-15]MBM1231043.1 pyruvate kinase [Ponticoccus sp. SC6-38]MBM1235705.1 pyruvate kinase [Ponticoccus sp. SC6-45]MBM1240065.1 pyruvate kinase [Ponticoccus sp. SC6-49]MBM1244419.1 pyruvate kinase [Ponticoccus sp. SC2-64]MBM1249179.1 pyruvate kinase [Ponticoccus sp. SC6-42]MBM1253720.1 pyruvate kinase [Ponticoccus sp. SC6-33]MBM1258073.1 pyruvate kinase